MLSPARFAPIRRATYGVLALLLALLPACGARADALARIRQAGMLRVGLDPGFPPFETLAGDAVVGFDVDLAHALAAELGVAAQFDVMGYDGLYDALATGRVDVLISALVVDPTRTRDFAYSQPYFNAGQVLVVARGSPIAQPAELAGQTLAVELGAQGHVTALEWARRSPAINIAPHATPDEALAAVAAGTAAAAIVDAVSARLHPALGDRLMIADAAVTVEPYAVVTRAEDGALLRAIDAALATLQRDGRLTAIGARWLSPP